MTNDKVRQDFEQHLRLLFAVQGRDDADMRFRRDPQGAYIDKIIEAAWWGYQAGRAAERAEIREKLESAEVKEAVGQSILGAPVSAENIFEKAKAAITKILEVI